MECRDLFVGGIKIECIEIDDCGTTKLNRSVVSFGSDATKPFGVGSGHHGRRATAILPPEKAHAILPKDTGGKADDT